MELPAIRKESQYQEAILPVSHCPMCEGVCPSESARVLGEGDGRRLTHIRCDRCSNTTISLTQTSSTGTSSVGLITDLDYNEVERFKEAPSVSTDDVIDVHRLLQDSRSLFSQLAVA